LTEAYIVSDEVARRRVSWIEQRGIRLPIDNLFEQMDQELKIQLYWLEDPVVEQGSKNGRFQSAIEPIQSRFMQGIKFMIQKFRRKYLYQLWS